MDESLHGAPALVSGRRARAEENARARDESRQCERQIQCKRCGEVLNDNSVHRRAFLQPVILWQIIFAFSYQRSAKIIIPITTRAAMNACTLSSIAGVLLFVCEKGPSDVKSIGKCWECRLEKCGKYAVRCRPFCAGDPYIRVRRHFFCVAEVTNDGIEGGSNTVKAMTSHCKERLSRKRYSRGLRRAIRLATRLTPAFDTLDLGARAYIVETPVDEQSTVFEHCLQKVLKR